ncbi:MAG: hypothetical protein JW881_14715 [Spirochaetales bacterium]|nr:hypothetical protein [Spirochaetales bacterium]
MNNRLKTIATIETIVTIARKKITETLLGPAFPISCTVGLVLGYLAVTGFIASIDADGINPSLNPPFELAIKAIGGFFGDAFFQKLFSEGPFSFALIVSYVPVLLYLAVSSVFKFGFEKNAGALELVIYGPVSVTMYAAASFIRNLFFSLGYLLVSSLILILYSLLTNTLAGGMFFTLIALLFFLSTATYGYTTLCTVLVKNGLAALPLFLGVSLFFIVLQLGTLTVTSGGTLNPWSALAWIFQWFSPLFYFNLGFFSLDYNNTGLLALSLFLAGLLAFVLLTASHAIARRRGGAA